MMYTLYYSPAACSLVIHALLIHLSLPFKVICSDIKKGQTHTPEFLKLNPRGQVPVLLEDGRVLRESVAIAMYLADTYGSPLLPKDTIQRQRMTEWLAFYNSSLHQTYSSYFMMSARLSDSAREETLSLVSKRLNRLWKEVESHLENNHYLCGNDLTLADLFHATIANWGGALAHPVVLGPNTRRLCAEVAALPYFKQALSEEAIDYHIK